MPPKKKKKKGKRREAEAATAQTDEDFDDMLAKAMAADLATPTNGSTSRSSSSAGSSSAGSSSTSFSSTRPHISEASILTAVETRDLARLHRWGRLGVRCDFDGPLCVAAALGNVAEVRCLIKELGADVNRPDENGVSPVFYAAMKGQLTALLCLIQDFGADANRLNKRGITPMIAAASEGYQDIVRVLVRDFGADLNHAAQDGSTALMWASYGKHASLVKWLVKEGADTQASFVNGAGAAELSKVAGASSEQTAYLEAKTYCSNTGCSGAGIMKCTGCKQARYCGGQCQLAHWKAHKTDCKRWSAEAKVGKKK
jgi:hypothetical protein